MLPKELVALGKQRSTIREIFEFGKLRAAEVGPENVFDFSIGNPSVPAPSSVKRALLHTLEGDAASVHGYTSAQGDLQVRETLAQSISKRFGASYGADDLYITMGAAAALMVTFKALCCQGDEVLVFAPYFPEYRCFIESGAGVKCVIVPPSIADFQIDFDAMEAALSKNTKAVVINSPNNPSGAVYSEATIRALAARLRAAEERFGHPIYLITDEPYREVVYDGITLPHVPNYYDNTILCYSYSKSLSLPGERIGYVLVSPKAAQARDVYAGICGAGRVLGYVCAPALFQQLIAQCDGDTADISIYQRNRDLLYEGLTSYGYTCVKPQGAFYLFPQSLEADDRAFCEKAKAYDLLLVPGSDFGAPGHVRISYCVQTETIVRALPIFAKLAKDYGK